MRNIVSLLFVAFIIAAEIDDEVSPILIPDLTKYAFCYC